MIGGGVGGLTFAAGAASLGARVELFEKNPGLLHLQRGCWHRPLHPEIFKWPDDTAYRVVSHLPMLGWSAGRAHDVADEILTKFKDVAQHLGEAKLKVRSGQTAELRADGTVLEQNMISLCWQSVSESSTCHSIYLGTTTGVRILLTSHS